MPRQATKALGNRYCQARLRAAKYNDRFPTTAMAAEELPGVSEDCLKKYELDITRPPNTVVALMADAYNAPELRAWYCSNECPLGRDCREIPEMPAERVVLRVQNKLPGVERDLAEIARIYDDGVIDEEEREQIPALTESILEAKRRLDEVLAVLEKAKKRDQSY